MELLPAIDIKDGSCVRLYQGDFATVHKVAEDVLETARGFEEAGARWVHMVDLDGALQGRRVNAPLFARVARETGLRVELGGGVRDMETVEFYLERGLSRLILGSAAVNCPGKKSPWGSTPKTGWWLPRAGQRTAKSTTWNWGSGWSSWE